MQKSVDESTLEAWERFLNPHELKESLVEASMFISIYEVCKDFIISKPRDLYTNDWGLESQEISTEYRSKVLSLSRRQSPLEASLLWLKSIGAINDSDINVVNNAREHRNEIAHELPKYLYDPERYVSGVIYYSLLEVVHKIGVFWVKNYELALDPDYSGKEIETADIQIGTVMMVQMIMEIAFGKEPESGYYHQEFKRTILKQG